MDNNKKEFRAQLEKAIEKYDPASVNKNRFLVLPYIPFGYKASYNNDENLNIIRNHRAVAEAYAAHCLDVYDHYAWRYWLETNNDKAWHFLAADDSWQDAYFSPDNQVKSAELKFWLGTSTMTDALPTPHPTGSTRVRAALQAQTGGLSPAIGPHAAKPSRRRKPR